MEHKDVIGCQMSGGGGGRGGERVCDWLRFSNSGYFEAIDPK